MFGHHRLSFSKATFHFGIKATVLFREFLVGEERVPTASCCPDIIGLVIRRTLGMVKGLEVARLCDLEIKGYFH